MLQNLNRLFQLQVVLFLLIQLALLYLQGGALRRHGNRCFLLLVVSTVCGICVLIFNGALVFFTPSEASLLWCYSLNFFFGAIQGFLGIIGAALLFRDYRHLAEQFSTPSATKDPYARNT